MNRGAAIGTGGDEPQFTKEEKAKFLEKKREREEERKKMIGRSDSLIWCTCSNCAIMSTDLECYCCNETSYLKTMQEKNEAIKCITEHPDFQSIVLNKKVLNMFRHEKVKNGDKCDERFKQNTNSVWRYFSYSTFIKWLRAEDDLGDEFIVNKRYVIPACVIAKIRQLYPSANGLYVGRRSVVQFGLATSYYPV